MPKVTEQHRQERKREILAAALRCFARKGFHATSMSDIISESGLSAGAIYGHYASKSALINTVATEVFNPDRPEMSSGLTGPGRVMHPVDFASRLLNSIIAEVGSVGLVVQVWGQAAVDESMREIFTGVYERLFAAFRRQIVDWRQSERRSEGADADARADHLTRLLTGITQGAVVQLTFYEDFDLVAYFDAARPLFD